VIVITKRDICIYATIKGAETSKQHRVDCLASKLHSSIVARLNCTVTWENADWNTWNTCCMQINWPQQRRRMAAEHLAFATARKRIFTSILNNVVTFRQRKRRKYSRTHTPYRTCTCRSCMSVQVNRHLHSAVDMTRLTHVCAPLTTDKSYSHLWTLGLEVILLLE